MTLWRPDNKGYCYSKENAGLYKKLSSGYVNGNSLLLVHQILAESLFLPHAEAYRILDKRRKNPTFPQYQVEGQLILNNAANRKILGVYYKNGELEVLNPLELQNVKEVTNG